MISTSGRCHYHPNRAGLGICVECKNVICVECTTQFEGINRCSNCLSAKLAKVKRSVARREWSFGNVFLALLSVGLLYGTFYFLASLVS